MSESLAQTVVAQMSNRRELFVSLEKLLVSLSGRTPPEFDPNADTNRRPEEKLWVKRVEFWKAWYEEQFGSTLKAASANEMSDEDLHRFLLTDSLRNGDSVRGSRIYESLQCHTCHLGGAPGREGRIFGPDLAGVTRRLSRQELADSLVFPSKQVADRFKAYQLERNDGATITGFVTEQTGEAVTIADQQQVHKVPRSEIKSLQPQSNSLMPDHLLNGLSVQQLRDLLAFLDQAGPASAISSGK